MPEVAKKKKRSLVYSTEAWDTSQLPDLPYNAITARVQVADPYNPARETRATRSLRNDPLGAMHAAGHIDDAQLDAGRNWQRIYINSQSPLQAINTTKEPVDGGGLIPEPITERMVMAQSELKQITKDISEKYGQFGNWAIKQILGDGFTITETADACGIKTERGRRWVGKLFRNCLETMAVVWGHAMPKRQSKSD